MRSKLIIPIVLITLLFNSSYSQFNQEEFLYRAKTIYHSLGVKGLANFTCWVTSDLFLETTKETYKEEIYPLQLIWKNPNMFYYIKRVLPVQKEGEQNSKAQELQMNMVQMLKGLFVDWQHFCGGNILDDLPESYLITTDADSAFVQYENYENGKLIKVKMTFGLNGICLKVKVEFPDKNEVIVTYPGFKLMGEKWLCTGWTVQTLRNGYVESGFMVKLRSREIENYWIPERLNLQLQKKGADDIRYTRTFMFKNILLNKELTFQP
jgi:hypothetical protein